MENNENNLGQLKKRLYKKGEAFPERERKDLTPPEGKKVSPYWQRSDGEKKTGLSTMKKFFIFLVAVFVALIGVILFFLFSEVTVVSSKNVKIEIKAPIHVEGGQKVNFNIFIENRNKSSLELADLIVDFPENVFSDEGVRLTRRRFSIGKIEPMEIVNQPIGLVFMGLEDEEKTIDFTVEYRLSDSNAIFEKSNEYTLKISKAPMGVSISMPKEINSKQEFELETEIVSNTDLTARDLYLQIEYPAGFQFDSAIPKPTRDNNIWSLGDVVALQEKSILIKGFIEGQDLDEKAFSALVGTISDSGKIMPYGTAEESVVIQKSAVDLLVFVQGENKEENIVEEGDAIRVDIQWLNNLPYPVRDAEITLALRGKGYSERTISTGKGFYRNYDKKIVWNTFNISDLGLINPGESGSARSSFSIQKPLPMSGVDDKNFSVVLDAEITGLMTSDNGENVEITGTESKAIKIASGLQLASRALYYSGDFSNLGPMPPAVGQETTYTVVWSLGGTVNDFSGVKVTATLPPYLQWVDSISPIGENVSFNEKDGMIVWDVGDISAGTGIITPARTVSFQVSFTPSLSQVGRSPMLVGETTVKGHDIFVDKDFEDEVAALNIKLNNDSQFKHDQGEVVE